MNYLPKTLFSNMAESEYDFICRQANEKNIAAEEYVLMCVLAYNDSLYISTLTNQLRRLRYQLKSTSVATSGDSQKQLIELQERIFTDIANALQMLAYKLQRETS